MNITFPCPHCEKAVRVDVPDESPGFACPACQQAFTIPSDAMPAGKLARCLVCPSQDLFIRKDFPQRLGVAIVTIGFALSCITWYRQEVIYTFAILFATALIDVVLYAFVGNSLVCYRCQAEYRQVPGLENHGSFNLETHERYRQQRIRLEQAAATSRTPKP